jgi:DNA-binding NtrC family response regulator
VSLNPVPGDRFLGAIEDIAAAVEAARQALDESTDPLVSVRRRRLAGASMLEIVDDLVAAGGHEALRRQTARAFAVYERAVQAFRGTVIRTLVDEEGASMSEVSRRLSISRQMTTRLYDAAGGDTST